MLSKNPNYLKGKYYANIETIPFRIDDLTCKKKSIKNKVKVLSETENGLIIIERLMKTKSIELYSKNPIFIFNSYITKFEKLEDIHYFRVNDFIELKLKNSKTIIYVNGIEFKQCKYILLNIKKNNIPKYDDINSIDDAIILHKSLQGETRYNITPEEEFKGHCSNLQVWVENDYDTRLLHSNLSFPLLKELVSVGDKLAQKVFKDEIAMRVEDGNDTTILYLLKEGYLIDYNKEEMEVIYNKINFNPNKRLTFELLKKFYDKGINKALDKAFELLQKIGFIVRSNDYLILSFLNKLTIEQVEKLYDDTSEEQQGLLKVLHQIKQSIWFLSKAKRCKHEKTQFLDFKYINDKDGW